MLLSRTRKKTFARVSNITCTAFAIKTPYKLQGPLDRPSYIYITYVLCTVKATSATMFPSSHDPVLIEIRDAHEGEEKAQQQRETKAAHELLVESPPKHAKTQMRRWCLKSNKSNCTTGPLPVSKNSYIYISLYISQQREVQICYKIHVKKIGGSEVWQQNTALQLLTTMPQLSCTATLSTFKA